MSEINTEAEAVAALERHEKCVGGPPCGCDADHWLAWLVRQGVDIESDDFDANGARRARSYVATYGQMRENTSPLVAATRAFLANREEQG